MRVDIPYKKVLSIIYGFGDTGARFEEVYNEMGFDTSISRDRREVQLKNQLYKIRKKSLIMKEEDKYKLTRGGYNRVIWIRKNLRRC